MKVETDLLKGHQGLEVCTECAPSGISRRRGWDVVGDACDARDRYRVSARIDTQVDQRA